MIKYGNLNKHKLEEYINKIIFNDNTLKVNNFEDIYRILNSLFNNRRFVSNLSNVKVNWLNIPSIEIISCILEFINEFVKTSI